MDIWVEGKRVVKEVSKRRRIPVDAIMGRYRGARVVAARHEAMVILRRELRFTLCDIAAYFDRDHTTVLHAEQKAQDGRLQIG